MMVPATCPACGRGLDCGADAPSCWCSDIPLADEVRAQLGATFEGCLCGDCLATVTLTAPTFDPASMSLEARARRASGYPPLNEMSRRTRGEFEDAILGSRSFDDLPGKWQAALLQAERRAATEQRAASPP